MGDDLSRIMRSSPLSECDQAHRPNIAIFKRKIILHQQIFSYIFGIPCYISGGLDGPSGFIPILSLRTSAMLKLRATPHCPAQGGAIGPVEVKFFH